MQAAPEAEPLQPELQGEPEKPLASAEDARIDGRQEPVAAAGLNYSIPADGNAARAFQLEHSEDNNEYVGNSQDYEEFESQEAEAREGVHGIELPSDKDNQAQNHSTSQERGQM